MLTEFFFSLIGGVFAVLGTGRLEQIAWRFLRTVGALQVALSAFTIVWMIRFQTVPPEISSLAVYILAGLAAFCSFGIMFFSPVANRNKSLFRLFCGVGALSSLALAAIYAISTLPADGTSVALQAAVVLSRITGALLIGSITVAWMLGHAYLTATRMTIAPLRHFSSMLSWSVILRFATVLVSVAIALLPFGTGVPWERLADAWLVVSLRVGVGLLALAIFAYMVADCVKLRSTQSATGILYFGSVFAYVGELASQHLVAECAWPM
ncbi:MAG: hypothetical protein ACPGXK_11500 [Phycisphaerae bacterium]